MAGDSLTIDRFSILDFETDGPHRMTPDRED